MKVSYMQSFITSCCFSQQTIFVTPLVVALFWFLMAT